MKKFLLLVAVMMSFVLVFVGCNTQSAPETAAINGYKNFINGGKEATMYFIDAEGLLSNSGSIVPSLSGIDGLGFGSITEEDEARLEEAAEKYIDSIKIKSVLASETEETAVVQLSITMPDLTTLIEALADAISAEVYEIPFSQLANMSMADIVDVVVSAIESINFKTLESVTIVGNVNMKLVDGEWKIADTKTILDDHLENTEFDASLFPEFLGV